MYLTNSIRCNFCIIFLINYTFKSSWPYLVRAKVCVPSTNIHNFRPLEDKNASEFPNTDILSHLFFFFFREGYQVWIQNPPFSTRPILSPLKRISIKLVLGPLHLFGSGFFLRLIFKLNVCKSYVSS